MTEPSKVDRRRRWHQALNSLSLSGLLSRRSVTTQGTERDTRSGTDVASSHTDDLTRIDGTLSTPQTRVNQPGLDETVPSIPDTAPLASTDDSFSPAEPAMEEFLVGTPFADLLDFLQEKEVFGKLGTSPEQAQTFRRNFVEGLQDVYKTKHLARKTPRNLVESYDFQVDGLVVQEVFMAAVYGTKTTILYFIMNSELSGEPRHCLPLKRPLQDMRMRLQYHGLSTSKPSDIIGALVKTISPLDELLQPETSQEEAAWAIRRYRPGGWPDFGYGVIANGEGE